MSIRPVRPVLVLAGLVLAGLVLPGRAGAEELRFKEQTIVGKIQKPEIEIYITKQNLTPKYVLDLRESFLPAIVQSVKKKPF